MTLGEQIKLRMVEKGLNHCDVAEAVIGSEVATVVTQHHPLFNHEVKAAEIHLYATYYDWLEAFLTNKTLRAELRARRIEYERSRY